MARILPRRRGARLAVWLALALAYAALMWVYVFPWVDRTFINQPAV